MPFNNEAALEDYVRTLIQDNLPPNNSFICLDSKSILDITIVKNGKPSAIFLIEAKLFKPPHGRMGVGENQGQGIQAEILANQFDYFNQNMRWLLARSDQDGYLFLTNEQILEYVNNGIQMGQQNNISYHIFAHAELLNDNDLINEINNWIGIDN